MHVNESPDGRSIRCLLTREELSLNDVDLEMIKSDLKLQSDIIYSVISTLSNIKELKFNMELIEQPVNLLISDSGIIIIELKLKEKIGSTKQSKTEQVKDELGKLIDYLLDDDEDDADFDDSQILFCVKNIDQAIDFSKHISPNNIKKSVLYKYKDLYYFFLKIKQKDNIIKYVYNLVSEFCYSSNNIVPTLECLKEHGDIVIKTNAINSLRQF